MFSGVSGKQFLIACPFRDLTREDAVGKARMKRKKADGKEASRGGLS